MINFNCKCGQKISVPQKYAGRKGKCPRCKNIVIIPSLNHPEQTIKDPDLLAIENDIARKEEEIQNRINTINEPYDTQSVGQLKLAETTKPCPYCGETILDAAKKCKHCGEFLTTINPPSPPSYQERHATYDNYSDGVGWSTGAFVGFIIGTIFIPLLGFITGIVGLCIRGKRKQGATLLTISILLPTALFGILFGFAVLSPSFSRANKLSKRLVCGTNLKEIGTAVILYADDNDDKIPTPGYWNDLLILEANVNPQKYICKNANLDLFTGGTPDKSKFANKHVGYSDEDIMQWKSCYAMNPNAYSMSCDGDTVLIFETDKSGWNMYGGPELLSAQNHEDEGCNILFVDGQVLFVEKEDFQNLNWGEPRESKKTRKTTSESKPDPAEIVKIGVRYYENGYYDEAIKCFKQAAELGNKEAMFALGFAYIQGIGVEEDYQKGIQLVKKAAIKGNVYAQDALDEMGIQW